MAITAISTASTISNYCIGGLKMQGMIVHVIKGWRHESQSASLRLFLRLCEDDVINSKLAFG